MSDIFVAIDGTTPDPQNNIRFEPWDFEYSFIYMIYRAANAARENKIHIPGPNLWGDGTVECIQTALEFLKPRIKRPDLRIVVAGYSRGAYAAIKVAQALEMIGRKVDFLGLIDVVKCTNDT